MFVLFRENEELAEERLRLFGKKRRLFGERPDLDKQEATFWEANTPKHERNPANHTTLLSYIAIKETRTQTHKFTNLTICNEKKAHC